MSDGEPRRIDLADLPRVGTVMRAQTEAVDFFAFDNSYARLPDRFFARLQPTPVTAPHLVRLNNKLAWNLELDPGRLAALLIRAPSTIGRRDGAIGLWRRVERRTSTGRRCVRLTLLSPG